MKHDYKTTFLEKEDADFYYILGAFMTDGSIYYNKSKRAYRAYLYSNDLEWLEKINKYFCETNCIYKNRKCFVLTISSKQIVEKFIKKGCVPKKSLILEFPNIPKIFLPDFIRGCLDGDGTIGIFKNNKYYTPTCTLCSSSYNFIQAYKDILTEYNMPYSFVTVTPKNHKMPNNKISYSQNHYIIKINNINKVKEFLHIIYYDNCNFVMKRKMDYVNKIFNLPNAKRQGAPKLNESQVLEIVKLYNENNLTQKEIAIKYGVKISCIKSIFAGRTWRDITKICKKKKKKLTTM